MATMTNTLVTITAQYRSIDLKPARNFTVVTLERAMEKNLVLDFEVHGKNGGFEFCVDFATFKENTSDNVNWDTAEAYTKLLGFTDDVEVIAYNHRS